MNELQMEDGERVVGRITAYRVLDAGGGMRDEVRSDDGHGEELDLPTAVGMLAVAQYVLLRESD